MKGLSKDNALRQCDMDEANRLGVTHMDYIQTVLQRMNDENEERIRNRQHHKITIDSNSCVVIGHGKNWDIHARKTGNLDIICTDVCANDMFEMGIIPKYIVTFEEAHKNVNEYMFDWNLIKKHGIPIIGSSYTREWLEEKCKKESIKFERFKIGMCGNVGLFGALVGYHHLQYRNIALIGMNCWGDENYPFLNWYGEWRYWVGQIPPKTFINCTEGGIIYFGKMLECDYNDLEVM